MPTERYAHAPEILEHCNRIATRYGLHDNALFHTEITDLEWDADRCRWIVRTDRGDEFTSQFVAIGTGPLHVAKLPGIPGIETFGGHAFHTSRWDYAYTGGDPDGAPMDRPGRQAGGHHRHRRDRGPVRPASGRFLPGAVRLPAHAVLGRRARQPADRPGVVRRRSPGPAGRNAGSRTSSPTCRPASFPPRTWSTTGGPTWPSGSAAGSRWRARTRPSFAGPAGRLRER